MAGVDKIYCYSKRDFIEFYNWCEKFKNLCLRETQKDMMRYFYTRPNTYDTDFYSYVDGVPIANFPTSIDKWLARHCPIRWIRENYPYIGEGCKKKEIVLYIDRGTMDVVKSVCNEKIKL